MDLLNNFIQSFNNFLWTYILIAMLLVLGVYFTWKTKFVQFRYIKEMFRLLGDGATAEKIGSGIELLIKQIKDSDPDINIILVSPIELGEGVWEEGFDTEFNENSVEVSKQLPEVYRKIAEKYDADFVAASEYARPSSADREHLNEFGHRQLAEAIYNQFYSKIREAV